MLNAVSPYFVLTHGGRGSLRSVPRPARLSSHSPRQQIGTSPTRHCKVPDPALFVGVFGRGREGCVGKRHSQAKHTALFKLEFEVAQASFAKHMVISRTILGGLHHLYVRF